MKKFVCLLAYLFASSAYAGMIPYGVQNNVALTTVTNTWGWTQIYRDDYGLHGVSYNDMFSGHLDYVMLGGIQDGSDTIQVLAAISWADFNTATAVNSTTTSNGAEWYNNNRSLGFADLGAVITQNSCNNNAVNAQTLCWHTNGSNGNVASSINGGWNVGLNTYLNSSTTWDRIIFTANAAPVSEPASLILFGLGLIGLGYARKKKIA
jgi:hypothetical protein